MRIISGEKKGRILVAPPGMDTRPTTDKVKEAVFSSIQFDLEGARVLDLFAGSGQMGLEALSRGAAACVFVEQGRAAQKAVETNVAALEYSEAQAKLVKGEAIAFLATCKPRSFDIIILDPPYGSGLLEKAIDSIAQFDILCENGIMICEQAEGTELTLPSGMELARRYRYGRKSICKVIKA